MVVLITSSITFPFITSVFATVTMAVTALVTAAVTESITSLFTSAKLHTRYASQGICRHVS
jgi:hypothetical protein